LNQYQLSHQQRYAMLSEIRSGKNVFLIKRFDRSYSPEGWLRNGFISSLSLMRLDEKDRLNWSYTSIAGLMRQCCPAGVGTSFNLAMTVGKQGRNATINNALSNCGQFGLSQKQAKELIDEITEKPETGKKSLQNAASL
jgi:serine/threonine-protein kinase HipA